MKKLTDETVSAVLSLHADGGLNHWDYYNTKTGCMCVAGVASCMERIDGDNVREISLAVGPTIGPRVRRMAMTCYPDDSDDMLRLLEKAGLA